jgi:hypothetical protein
MIPTGILGEMRCGAGLPTCFQRYGIVRQTLWRGMEEKNSLLSCRHLGRHGTGNRVPTVRCCAYAGDPEYTQPEGEDDGIGWFGCI